MDDSLLLLQLILLLALAAAGLALFERFKLPAIAGFLVVGAIAGPGGLGAVADPASVRTLAEFGVIFLLFEIGLELPLERLRDLGRTALVAGGIQVVVTVALVAIGAWQLGIAPASALVLGGLVAMSSTALVVRMLSDDGQIDAPHGQLAIAVLVFQDLSIVPFLLGIPLLAGAEESSVQDLLLSLARMAGAFALLVFIVRFAVPRVLSRVAEARSPDLFSILAMLIVLGSATLAEQLGLTLAIGAFMAGVAATSSPYAQQLFSEVVPLRGVLLGIFFTAVGMLFEPRVVLEHAPLVILYLLTTIVLKAGVIAATNTLLLGRSLRVGLLAGLALSQTGEFSFILAEAASRAGLLDESLYQVVLAGSVLSLVASPFLVRASPHLAELASRWLGERDDEALRLQTPHGGEDLCERVLVIGFGLAGQTLARLLRAIDVPYVILDANARAVTQAQERGEAILFGDATRPTVLKRLSLEQAKLVAVAISDPLATRRIVSRIRLMAPETPILARSHLVSEVDQLDAAGATSVVAEEFEGSIAVVARALELFQIPAGAISSFTDALREEGYGAIREPASHRLDPWLVELLNEAGTHWVQVPERFPPDRSLRDLDLRARTGANILVVERDGASISNPGPTFALHAGDRLLVLGDADDLAKLGDLLGETPSQG